MFRRGFSFHPHYHSYGFGHGLGGSLMHGFAWGLGWHMAGSLFRGFPLLFVIFIILVIWFLVRRRR